jgi:hypothetical protein
MEVALTSLPYQNFITGFAVNIDYTRLNISNFETGIKDKQRMMTSKFISYFIRRNIGQE